VVMLERGVDAAGRLEEPSMGPRSDNRGYAARDTLRPIRSPTFNGSTVG